jgi:hypothetical protein
MPLESTASAPLTSPTPVEPEREASDSTLTEDDLAPLDLGDNKTVLDSYKDITAVVRQSKDYTCGPASLATLMIQRGDDTTEAQMLEVLPEGVVNPEKGVTMLSLNNAAIALGQQVVLKKWSAQQVLSYIEESGDPVLIDDEKQGVGGHFSVIRSYTPAITSTTRKKRLLYTKLSNMDYRAGDSLGMSLFSGIGEGYDILTLLNGTDPMTKEQLTSFTRNITIVGLVSGIGSCSAARRAVTEGLERLTEGLGTHGDDLMPNAQEVLKNTKCRVLQTLQNSEGK